jgi:hypothetical protein
MDVLCLSSLSVYTRISIWSTLVPIACALLTIRRVVLARAMSFLLLAGLATELSTLCIGPMTSFSNYAFLFYSILECAVFFAVINDRLSPFAGTMAMLVFTGTLLFGSYLFTPNIHWLIAIFNMAYQVVIAFLAGRYLLKEIEQSEAATERTGFWIVLGIFFYCFATFFLMGTIALTSADWVWDPFHNTINMATYGIYAFGFWKAYRPRPRGPVRIRIS